ncbi:MAG: sigma-70 family RNA polymerase sigma factor [Bacteroidales bacterium]|nr:sigma-70 family RNA polymerase sigma factor [Bacteroidales bacterium]
METSGKTDLVQWVDLYTNELYTWALHKVSDSELAKDLVQDTFLAASEKLSSFKGNSSPKTWLFSILNHKIIDYYRKKVKQATSLDHSDSMFFDKNQGWLPEKQPKNWHEDDSNLLDDNEFQTVLKKCLEALPEKWNSCVKLKYLMNKNGDEICQELNITPSNFWQIVHRAKLQLRDCVETNWFQNL